MKLPIRLRSSKIAYGFLLLLALTACDIYPDSGKWAGDLTIHDEFWHDRYSCQADVEITHTKDVVSLNSFDSFCGTRSVHWSPGALSRRGMGLFRGDEQVGNVYPDGTVTIEIKDPYYTEHYPKRVEKLVLSWTPMGENLQFSLKEVSFEVTTVMEGTLHRVH